MWWRRVRWFLTLVALCAIATCPSAKRSCTARNRAQEADDLLGVLGERVASAVAVTGKVPPTPAGPSPQASCCDQGGTCNPDMVAWSAQGWRELKFSIDGPYRYQYQYLPDPSGQSAVIRATGDLDCNGVSSTYELQLTVQGSTPQAGMNPARSAPGVRRAWRRKNPYE